MKRLLVTFTVAVCAFGVSTAGASPAKQHRHGWTAKQEREFLHGLTSGYAPASVGHCLLRVVERYFPTHAAFNKAADTLSPQFTASVNQAQQECPHWTPAEEADFLHGTGQPGSKLYAHAQCVLRNVEKVFPTWAQWKAETQRLADDPGSPSKLDRTERGCKLP
jgi:hypothetical protein